MSARWLAASKAHASNLAARLLLAKPQSLWGRWLQRAVAAVIPKVQAQYMRDALVEAEIEFDAQALRRSRGADRSGGVERGE